MAYGLKEALTASSPPVTLELTELRTKMAVADESMKLAKGEVARLKPFNNSSLRPLTLVA